MARKKGTTIQTIEDLKLDPHNANKGTDKGRGMVADSLSKVGAGRSIVVDRRGVVLAGNKTAEQWKASGGSVQVVETDGSELVVVVRRDLDLRSAPKKARALAYLDNRSAEVGLAWDIEQILRDRDAGLVPEESFTDAELSALIKELSPGDTGLELLDDAVPAARATDIAAGMMFELGRHRLICGDATDPATVARLLGNLKPHLMVTDPPYGVEYDPSWRAAAGVNKNTKKLGKVANDDRADWREAWALFPGDVAYVWHASLFTREVLDSLEACGFQHRSMIIWAKDRFTLGRGHYHWQHEPCWYVVREGAEQDVNVKGRRRSTREVSLEARDGRGGVGMDGDPGRLEADEVGRGCLAVELMPGHYHWQHEPCWYVVRKSATGHWSGDRSQSTLWNIKAREDDGHGHGTQKPVECMARPIRNNSSVGQAVYEPFSGSGTTLVAAEQLERVCLAVELMPSYVQVAIDRWEALTGQKAKRVA